MEKCIAYQKASGKAYGYCLALNDCTVAKCGGNPARCDFCIHTKEEEQTMEKAKAWTTCQVDMRALNRALGFLEGLCAEKGARDDSGAGRIMAAVLDIESAILEARE